MEQKTNHFLLPESLKDHPVIFFDGVCGFCNQSVNFVLKRDRNALFRFAPLQGETARASLPEKSFQNLNSMVYLDETGEYYQSAAAVRILRNMSGIWYLLGSLLWLIPKPLREAGYFLLAKWRYQLFGKLDSCRIPTPEEQARFLP